MTQLNSTDGFIFHGWMVTELHLEGGDLFAFALVYSFTRSGAGIYKGNTAYLSAWTGWSERTSRAHLLALQERGLIAEVRGRESNTPFCYYKLGAAFQEWEKSTPQKFQGHPAKNDKSTPQKLRGENTNRLCVSFDKSQETRAARTCVKDNPPSFEEVEAYARHRGFADPSGFAAYYLAVQAEAGWMTGKGNGRKAIDNWKLNVLAWEPNHKFREFSAPTPGPSPRRGKESLSENWSRTARELGIKIDEDYEQQ